LVEQQKQKVSFAVQQSLDNLEIQGKILVKCKCSNQKKKGLKSKYFPLLFTNNLRKIGMVVLSKKNSILQLCSWRLCGHGYCVY
jgi:hypothetical protein